VNPLRLLLAIYARLEWPLLRFNYGLVRSPLVRWPVTRQLLWLGVFLPISCAGAAGQPMTADEAVELLQAAGEEGVIAVGPCGCRTVHRGCDHTTRTDFTVYEGVEAWSRAHPAQYQVVSLAESRGHRPRLPEPGHDAGVLPDRHGRRGWLRPMQLLSGRLPAADEPPGLPQLPVHPGNPGGPGGHRPLHCLGDLRRGLRLWCAGGGWITER
jgi:hypothetical protein